jgi:hypothetical protein
MIYSIARNENRIVGNGAKEKDHRDYPKVAPNGVVPDLPYNNTEERRRSNTDKPFFFDYTST